MSFQELDIPITNIVFKVESPFGNLFRAKHVMIVISDNQGRIIVSQKKGFYPEGMLRFIGGGVEKSDSSYMVAAIQEGYEELRTIFKPEDLTPLTIVNSKVVDSQNNQYELDTCLFFAKYSSIDDLTPSDDIDGLQPLTLGQLYDVVEYYENLPPTLRGEEGGLSFTWQDYGKLYGPIHRIAADIIQERSLLT